VFRTNAKCRVNGRTSLDRILVRHICGVKGREKLGLIALGARQSALERQGNGRSAQRASLRRWSLLCGDERGRNPVLSKGGGHQYRHCKDNPGAWLHLVAMSFSTLTHRLPSFCDLVCPAPASQRYRNSRKVFHFTEKATRSW